MRSTIALLVTWGVCTSALADTAALQRCRQLTDPGARLACYDALVLPALTPGTTTGRNEVPAVASQARSTHHSTATAAEPAVANPTDRFGLESRPQLRQELPELESAIQGHFDGWIGRARFRLANGQVWEITDGTQASYEQRSNPKVKITRGLSGTFFMEIDGVSQTPRVRRVH